MKKIKKHITLSTYFWMIVSVITTIIAYFILSELPLIVYYGIFNVVSLILWIILFVEIDDYDSYRSSKEYVEYVIQNLSFFAPSIMGILVLFFYGIINFFCIIGNFNKYMNSIKLEDLKPKPKKEETNL